jgi:hypothetical protein
MTARGLIMNSTRFNRSLHLLELFLAKIAHEEETGKITKPTYDILWNISINFKYLLSKPLNA